MVAVDAHQPLGGHDEAAQVGDVRYRCPWVGALDEQRLALVQVADAGEIALVEQCFADRPVGLAG
jgi:hypothetical protein